MKPDPPIRVLLVEDNPGDARLIAESLAAGPSHFELRTADRLADFLPALAAGPADIILLDLGLPDGQGLDSFRTVQAAAPGIPIVVLSGLSDQDVAIRAVREGAQDYLVKGKLDGDPLPRIVRHAVERQRADEALRRSQARFRAAVEASPDAFLILEALRDATGRILAFVPSDMNTRAERLLGRPLDSISGRPIAEWCTFANGFDPTARCAEVITTRRSLEEELTLPAPSGAPLHALCQIFPMGDGVAMIIRDITARKRMEDQLRHTQKMEAVGQLAAGVAHDFRNLISAIQGHLAHARRLLPADHPAAPCLDQIEEAARQAGGITGPLLTFTHKSPIQKHPVDLASVVQQAVGLLRHSLPASVRVETRIAAPALYVSADTSQLQQVIMNLAINARDAMPGGGALTIEAGPGQPDGTITPGPRGIARLRVRDTGLGMTPEVRARIFEPYFTTKPRGQGTGLGLSIIHGIVSEHGGAISVDSRPGEGASFTILLPAVEPPTPPTPAVPRRTGRSGSLLADANPFVREVMASMLASLGFEVLQAADCAGAVRLARSSGLNIELIIAAAQLPDGSGAECIRQVRAAGQGDAKAILLTPEEAPPADGYGILVHPFRRADLAREIERLRLESEAAPL